MFASHFPAMVKYRISFHQRAIERGDLEREGCIEVKGVRDIIMPARLIGFDSWRVILRG